MAYPNFPGKHRHESLFARDHYLDYLREQQGLHPRAVPSSMILCYSARLFRKVCEDATVIPIAHRSRNCCFAFERADAQIGIAGGFGIGAPAASTLVEELIALGVHRFISIGAAGSLSVELAIGDVVVCTEAIRDEGVSHHYLPAARTVSPSRALTSRLEEGLRSCDLGFVRGATWTIDTPYRETVEEIRHYQSHGVLTVEMEAAALFAVGEYRGVDVAAAFVVSDQLGDLVWEPQLMEIDEPLEKLFEASFEGLDQHA